MDLVVSPSHVMRGDLIEPTIFNYVTRLLKPAARTASLSFILIHVIFILSYQNQIHTKKTKAQNSRRTLDNPHKCLILNFPKTPHFCPRKIFKIWAFLTKMTPDLPAGSPYLTKHGSNLRLITILEFTMGQI